MRGLVFAITALTMMINVATVIRVPLRQCAIGWAMVKFGGLIDLLVNRMSVA